MNWRIRRRMKPIWMWRKVSHSPSLILSPVPTSLKTTFLFFFSLQFVVATPTRRCTSSTEFTQMRPSNFRRVRVDDLLNIAPRVTSRLSRVPLLRIRTMTPSHADIPRAWQLLGATAPQSCVNVSQSDSFLDTVGSTSQRRRVACRP